MYTHVVLGGTFDHFHAGHRDLLAFAFSRGEKVTLGLTKASMNRKKEYSSEIQSFQIRKSQIVTFSATIERDKDLHIIPIADIFGSTLTDPTLQAIIVTPHTKKSAEYINSKRTEIGLHPLSIELCPLRTNEQGDVICSSGIRGGAIDRDGNIYTKLFENSYQITETARTYFQRPLGKKTDAHQLRSQKKPIIVVGDIATAYCIQHDVSFSHAFIDGKSQKKDYSFQVPSSYTKETLELTNPAGTIQPKLASFLMTIDLNQKKTVYQITGEEDLLTVAAVILLPFGTKVVYGYPFFPQSLRMITVNERIKERFSKILFP